MSFKPDNMPQLSIYLTVANADKAIDFYQKAAESKKRKERAETELLELQKRKENLENKIQSLSSPVGVEKELREKFDLVKEGEETILIGDSKGTSSQNQ